MSAGFVLASYTQVAALEIHKRIIRWRHEHLFDGGPGFTVPSQKLKMKTRSTVNGSPRPWWSSVQSLESFWIMHNESTQKYIYPSFLVANMEFLKVLLSCFMGISSWKTIKFSLVKVVNLLSSQQWLNVRWWGLVSVSVRINLMPWSARPTWISRVGSFQFKMHLWQVSWEIMQSWSQSLTSSQDVAQLLDRLTSPTWG